ncbi:DUF349 domain-containing protein [Flavobacteriaceae bacterium]|nr:DUF349 domain-containing protein [Flavobacteriaceae bacterium]
MEEHTLQPGAEEQKKPQNTIDETSEEAQTKEEVVPIESPAKGLDKSEKTKQEVIEKEIISPQENTSEEETEAKKTEKNQEEEEEEETHEKEVDYTELSIEELIEAYQNLSTDERWLKNHKSLQTINTLFEEKFKVDVEQQKKRFIEEGGNEIDFFFKPEYKKRFDQITFEYRKKRRTHFKDQEAIQKVNLERRNAIITEIKNLIDQNQINSTTYKTFRTLQESWYNTGQVPRSESQNLWETFKHHVERFYAFLHLDREFRELDFKHNYEEKLKIIERAEALQEYPDIIKASRDLNILHQQWKNDLGPVAKEHREDLWTRFQNASKIIQSRRQEYQKDVVGAMKENLAKKEALLKEMRSLIEQTPETHNAWQNALKKFNSLRDAFKAIGFVPAKESKASWKSFREIGTEFMRLKNLFYKEQKKAFNTNIESKKALIERSKEILELENWDTKVQDMKDIQKEWKSIGFVPRKLDNKLWKEFSDFQKEYFDRLKSGYQRLTAEQENVLKEKTALLEKVKTHQFTPEKETLKNEYFDQWEAWNQLGSLDSSNESKMNQSFSNALIQQIKSAGLEKNDLNEVLKALQANLLQNDPERLDKEFQSVRNNLSNLKAELTQLENNLEFFSNSSSENPLYKNVEKQILSCQNKIDKTKEEYIRLKQIKNAQEKLVREAAAAENNTDPQDQEPGEEE